MGTLWQLFTILDGYDDDRPPAAIALSPDPALEGARRALRSGAKVEEALEGLAEQIRLVRSVMRALSFDLVERDDSNQGWSRDKAFLLASDLHRYSALLLLKLDRMEPARRHLLCAIVCRPDDPNLSFHLVDAYVREGRFAEGFALLDRTYDTFAPGAPEQILALYRLTLDAHIDGRTDEARRLYESILRKPHAGVFAELCHRQVNAIDRAVIAVPGIESLNRWYGKAVDSCQAGRYQEAISLSYDLLAWKPTHETSWFLLGFVYAGPPERDARAGNVRSIPTSIDDDRRRELEHAVQALQIASSSEERPDLRLEAQRLQTSCYLELGDPASAVECAIAVTEMDGSNSGSWANLSVAQLANHALGEAQEAALKALQLDQHDPVAARTLATLRRVDELLET